LVGFWHNRPLRWLLAGLIAAGFVYRGFLTFLSLHVAAGGSVASAPYVMSAVLLAGMVAQRVGGEWADRGQCERLLVALAGLLSLALLALAFSRGTAAIGLALLCGFVWALAQPVANTLTAAYARPADHGLLYGIQFAATFAVGSFATTAGGVFLAKGGTRLVFLGLAGVALVELGAVVAMLASAAVISGPPVNPRVPSMSRIAPPTRDADAGAAAARAPTPAEPA
jgi:MFS family permease